jgi:hypothetical protein
LLPLLHVILCKNKQKQKQTRKTHPKKNHPTTPTKAAKQIPSGLKSKISYTPEDGHVGRNISVNIHNKTQDHLQ